MRRKLHVSFSTLVVFCAVASVAARAQEASQSSGQPKRKTQATTAAKKAAAKKAAAKKPATQTPAPAQAAETTATGATAAEKAVQDASATKKPVASGVAAKRQAAAARAARKKRAGEADAPDAAAQKADAPSEKADTSAPATDANSATSRSPAATDAAPTQSPAGAANKAAKPQGGKGQKKAADAQAARAFDPVKAAELKARLAEIQRLPVWERISELQDFLDLELPDDLADRATEHLVSAEAAYGDERLQAGDAARGIALFRDAVADADEEVSDRLFYEVVSQLPANLVLRGQTQEAFALARKVEKLARGDAKRLLALAAFYVSAEQPDEAARLSAAAIKLAPDLAAAHQGLAAADRLSLRLDESVAEYARAAELDPKSAAARASLADLRRATGKPEEALSIYRELLASDATNRGARNGVVLSLFEAGQREEAERELESALKDDPHNIQLLAGAAYWYAAHGDYKHALDFAGRVVQVEPRHPWAQVALSRALIANEMPFDAERMMRFVRLYSRFPTLDYELANALAAEGFYAEAAEELAHTFTLKGDEIETRLAGRTNASATNFIELLAPERRASFFEPAAADTPENARQLKGLLTLYLTLRSTETNEPRAAAAETTAAQAARDFAAGDDAARAFRQLYAANRLLRRNVATGVALELVVAARKGVEAAIATPQATAAVTADELRSSRASAIAQGSTPDLPDVPRDTLDRLMRGRIEELTGWALLNQGRAKEAVAPLRQAVGVLPENSLYWRNALWRLGNAYAASGEPQQALNTYVKSFDQDNPDEARFAVIQSLYRKLNGNLNGLDVLFGLAPARASSSASAAPQPAPVNPAQPWAGDAAKLADQKIANAATNDAATEATTSATKNDAARRDDANAIAKDAESNSATTKKEEPKKEEPRKEDVKSVEQKSSESAPPPASSEVSAPPPQPATQGVAAPTPEPSPIATPTEQPPPPVAAPSPETPTVQKKASAPRAGNPTKSAAAERAASARSAGECTLALDAESLSLAGGTSAVLVALLEGGGDASKITATTPNWSDIIVLRESASADAGTVKFTITSISKNGGDYAVTVKSPCGAKKITVTVK